MGPIEQAEALSNGVRDHFRTSFNCDAGPAGIGCANPLELGMIGIVGVVWNGGDVIG